MTLSLDWKVPGGKLLRLFARIEGGQVVELRVAGDFFAHPEEAFDAAEASLLGIAASDLPSQARIAFAHPGLRLFGLSPEALGLALEALLATQDHA